MLPAFFLRNRKALRAGMERAPVQIRLPIVALQRFFADQAPMRAAALTYTTLLSFVPVLAFGFALLRGFGFHENLLGFLLGYFAPATSPEVQARIAGYISRVNARTLGALGLGTFLVTVVITMGTVEQSFNAIFGVRRQRPLVRKFTDYFSMILVAPLLFGITVSGTALFQIREWLSPFGEHWLFTEAGILALELVPLGGAVLLFASALIILPNTQVRLVPAVLGGLVGGVAWFFLQGAYVRLQFGFSRHEAIFGAMAQLPILMIWLYLTWCIAFYAAELTALVQEQTGPPPREDEHLAGCNASDLALRAMAALARRSTTREPPWNLGHLAKVLDASPEILETVVDALKGRGLIAEAQEDRGLLLARHPVAIPALEIFDAVGVAPEKGGGKAEGSEAAALLLEMEQRRRSALEGITLENLRGAGPVQGGDAPSGQAVR